MNITLKDIPHHDGAIALPNGCTLNVKTKHDDTMGPPWEEHDGHGPVSDWTTRDKRAGERVLCGDRSSRRYYDFAEAMRIAMREGWGLTEEKLAALERGMGRKATKGEICAAAVESDFEHLRSWCVEEWHWLGVIVTLEDADGRELGRESLWGIESDGDYWREVALELAETLIEAHCKEETERAYWEARDVETVTT